MFRRTAHAVKKLPRHPGMAARQSAVKELFYVSNMWLKVVTDVDGLYGGNDDDAMKAASSAVRAARAYGSTRVSDLVTPLSAVVDYRGFRVLATASVPFADMDVGWNVAGASKAGGAASGTAATAGEDSNTFFDSDDEDNQGFSTADAASQGTRKGTAAAAFAAARTALVAGSADRGLTVAAHDPAALKKLRRAGTVWTGRLPTVFVFCWF